MKDGKTLREHLEAVERQTGHTPVELISEDFPETLFFAWSTFLELSANRTTGFNGPNPISYVDIKAYQDVRGVALPGCVVDIVLLLDDEYFKNFFAGSQK